MDIHESSILISTFSDKRLQALKKIEGNHIGRKRQIHERSRTLKSGSLVFRRHSCAVWLQPSQLANKQSATNLQKRNVDIFSQLPHSRRDEQNITLPLPKKLSTKRQLRYREANNTDEVNWAEEWSDSLYQPEMDQTKYHNLTGKVGVCIYRKKLPHDNQIREHQIIARWKKQK